MARKVEVEITGDSRSLERAFDRSAKSAQQFERSVERSGKSVRDVFGRRIGTIARVGFGAVAVTTGLQAAAEASREFAGENSKVTNALDDMSAAVSSLLRLDLAGFFAAAKGTARQQAALEEYNKSIVRSEQFTEALAQASLLEAIGHDKAAASIRLQVEAIRLAEQEQRKLNQTIVNGIPVMTRFTGAVDDLNRARGPGGIAAEQAAQGGALVPLQPIPGRPLSPSQRRELALIGTEALARIPLLRDRLRQLKGQLDDITLSNKEREQISRNIANTEAEISGIYRDQAAQQKAAREAAAAEAKRRREAARAAEQARELAFLAGPIPTPQNLAKQLAALQARVAAGETVPQKLVDGLGRVAQLLREEIEPDTREAIRDYLAMVRSELSEDKLRPVAAAAINTQAILGGLGLSRAEILRLRARLGGVTAGRKSLVPTAGVSAYGMTVTQGDVYLDGDKVGKVTGRYGQRNKIRSPTQKRGPNAGRSGI